MISTPPLSLQCAETEGRDQHESVGSVCILKVVTEYGIKH